MRDVPRHSWTKIILRAVAAACAFFGSIKTTNEEYGYAQCLILMGIFLLVMSLEE